jgi:hypothetical protein
MTPGDNVLKDLTYNSETVLFWGGSRPASGFGGGTFSRLCCYWTQVGIEQIVCLT